MICFMDRTFCSSPNCENKCGRKFTEELRQQAIKWWGGKDFPISMGDFCSPREVKDERVNSD